VRISLLFASLFAVAACAPAAPRPTLDPHKQARGPRCEVNDDCVLEPVSCCGDCGAARTGDVRAVHRDRAGVRAGTCGDCPACAGAPDPMLVPYYTCGSCRVLDLHRSAFTRCARDEDCVVRHRGCCDCGPAEWVAVRRSREANYVRQLCGPVFPCPDCLGLASPDAAVCDHGRCAIRRPSDPLAP
jgi:hypothetical protein